MRARWTAVTVLLFAAWRSDDDTAVDATTTTAAPPTTVLAPEGHPITDVADWQVARLELVSPDWLVADDTDGWRLEQEEGRRQVLGQLLTLVLGEEPDELLVTTLWILYGPGAYLKLVHDAGMNREEYEAFLVDAMKRLIAAR